MSAVVYGQHGRSSEYLELVSRFELRPIRSDAELRAASEVVDRLLDYDELSQDASDYLSVLSSLIQAYEDEHCQFEPPGDADVLRHLMEARNINQSQLAQATGIVYSTISNVLSGKRQLTRGQIGTLSKYFGVSPKVFSFPTD